MNSVSSTHEKHSLQLAKELEDEGYSVVLTPPPERIPFSLEGYVPDLIATKKGDHLIVEIKGKSSPQSVQKLRKASEIVAKHPGWRLLVKTIPDADSEMAGDHYELKSVREIEEYIEKAGRIVDMGSPELAVPYLWNAATGLLRVQASQADFPGAELSDRSLINQLYTMGFISIEDYQKLRKWNLLRNDAVHSISFRADAAEVKELLTYVKNLAESVHHQPLS